MNAEPLQPTRVHRFYRGGALLGRLRGEPEEDGFFPEDWLGSVTPARNPGRNDRSEEHTSELQSPLNTSSAVFCVKKKKRRSPPPSCRPPRWHAQPAPDRPPA